MTPEAGRLALEQRRSCIHSAPPWLTGLHVYGYSELPNESAIGESETKEPDISLLNAPVFVPPPIAHVVLAPKWLALPYDKILVFPTISTYMFSVVAHYPIVQNQKRMKGLHPAMTDWLISFWVGLHNYNVVALAITTIYQTVPESVHGDRQGSTGWQTSYLDALSLQVATSYPSCQAGSPHISSGPFRGDGRM